MYKTRLTLTALAMVLLFGTFAHATPSWFPNGLEHAFNLTNAGTIVYDNGGPNQANGNEMTEWIQSEEFSLATATTLTDIHFWDFEATGAYTGSISWWITGDVGGKPDFNNILASGSGPVTHTDTGVSLFFGEEFTNDWTISPLALAAGTEYHLALHNGPLTVTTRNNMYWETTGNVDAQTGLECNLTNGACSGIGAPEPGTLLMFGSSVVGIAGMLRRKLFS